MFSSKWWALFAAVLSALMANVTHAQRSFLLNGLDSKVVINAPGKLEFVEPGTDIVNILDISDPRNPKLAANLALSNSLFGPPTNLQVGPRENIALVTSAVKWEYKEDKWKPVPDNRLFVIDLTRAKPELTDTLSIGSQPSGISISPSGSFALVANRADRSIDVLEIDGLKVSRVQTVDVTDEVAAVAITPDESMALIVKNKVNKVGVLNLNDRRASYDMAFDMPVGQFPYNIDISPDGSFALVAHTGNGGRSDGHADPLAIVRLDGRVPYVSKYVTAGDAPEAFAISPSGDIAVALLLGGDTILPSDHWAHANPGEIVVFKISKDDAVPVQRIPVRGLPEGVAFSPDGSYAYVSSFKNQELMVFEVIGESLVDTNVRVALPGTPASMRGRAR